MSKMDVLNKNTIYCIQHYRSIIVHNARLKRFVYKKKLFFSQNTPIKNYFAGPKLTYREMFLVVSCQYLVRVHRDPAVVDEITGAEFYLHLMPLMM